MLIQGSLTPQLGGVDRTKIVIINTGQPIPYAPTSVDAGPATGGMLNAHFFPGINFYNAGRYANAEAELGYVAGRRHYLEGNSRREEFMSTANYLLGMIYMYHAEGVGRRNIAETYFDRAIAWNPSNYTAYIELSRIFTELRLPERARGILQRLLDLNPPDDIAKQARDEMSRLSNKTNTER